MRTEFLSRVPLFSMLDENELSKLLDDTTSVVLAGGEFLFRRGEYGDALYIVETGLLDAVIDEGTPSERSLNTLFPGDFFGEMALLTQEPRSASMRALMDCTLIRISQEQFADLLENKPRMALYLSKVLSHYLSRTNTHLSRRNARINTVIQMGDPALTSPLAAQMLESLERQCGRDAIIVIIGDVGLSDTMEDDTADPGNLLDRVNLLPSGGHYLRFGDHMDDHALVSAINGLRNKYGHIIVWTSPAEALKRVSFLVRFDQTFLIASHPSDYGELTMLSTELGKVLKNRLRTAFLASGKQAPPTIPMAPYPPIRLTITSHESNGKIAKESIDRLARAFAGLTVGLALGSGTAQGMAHLGVMKALIGAGIPVDLIAGTSGGALYGSLVASGLSIDESIRSIMHHTRKNLIDKLDFAIPTRGLIRGNRIESMVQSMIGDITFPDLPIPLCAVSADLDTGEEVIIQEGLVYQGVRASISVPGIFEPYRLNGRTLIDGVVVNPLPVSVARSMGANIVIAVGVPAPGKVNMDAKASKRGRKNDYGMFSSIVRSHHFVGEKLSEKVASDADVFIKPDVGHFGWREYRSAPEIIEAGIQAGEGSMMKIKDLLGSSSQKK